MTRVLLVEDQFPDALLLQEWLEASRAGWEVQHVETFAEAAQRWGEGAFEALLLDLDLPDGFGLELLGRALQLAGERPVVVLSGLADDTVAARAVELGALAYVVKGQRAVQELVALLSRPVGESGGPC